jgi:hypothetical protein
MKIALMHYSSPPVVGGVESVLAHHARLMKKDGHDVTAKRSMTVFPCASCRVWIRAIRM